LKQQSVLRVRIGILPHQYLGTPTVMMPFVCPKCLVSRHRDVRPLGTTPEVTSTNFLGWRNLLPRFFLIR
jgi:hypothetical protein